MAGINQIVCLGGRLYERCLCFTSFLCGPAEVLHRTLTWTGDDLELLTTLFQFRKTRHTLVQQVNAAIPDGITQVFNLVDRLCDEICHGVIKRQAVRFGVCVQPCHVHAEADTVKRLIERGKEGKISLRGQKLKSIF